MTTTFQDPDPSLTAWMHQLDPALAVFDQIVDNRLAAFSEDDRRPRCEHWSDTTSRLCPELARDDTRFCRMHQPRPVCTGTTAGNSSEAPRPCKAPAMKGYSACCRHVEGEEKARYDREQEELARAEAKKDVGRARRQRERREAIASDRISYLAGDMPDFFFEVMPAPFEALGFRIGRMYQREIDIVCELCGDDGSLDRRTKRQWAEAHLRECPVSS